MEDFSQWLCDDLGHRLLKAPVVENEYWQSTKVSQGTRELLNTPVTLNLNTAVDGDKKIDLGYVREHIEPNLPWADKHFEQERVSGEPINPGTTWREWPYALSADKHRRSGADDPQFDHSYAERYWPKFAGLTSDGLIHSEMEDERVICGIRFPYGDLDDIVTLLCEDRNTRQAYLPVWFPEDLTAAKEKKRVPCTLGYHFILRDQQLHIVYPMRSCDFIRHFRDDVYLTIRLLLWVLERCRERDNWWDRVIPGTLSMYITSLHIFESDTIYLKKLLDRAL